MKTLSFKFHKNQIMQKKVIHYYSCLILRKTNYTPLFLPVSVRPPVPILVLPPRSFRLCPLILNTYRRPMRLSPSVLLLQLLLNKSSTQVPSPIQLVSVRLYFPGITYVLPSSPTPSHLTLASDTLRPLLVPTCFSHGYSIVSTIYS